METSISIIAGLIVTTGSSCQTLTMLESAYQDHLLLLAPARLPQLRLFRRNVAKVRIKGRVVRFAIAGQCDLYGIFKRGMHVELELKGPRGVLEPDQESWRDFCFAWGVPWLLLKARKEESVEGCVERWIGEISAVLKS